jgi:hypothetical protein
MIICDWNARVLREVLSMELEITGKGPVNQAVLKHRAALIKEVYGSPIPEGVTC